MNGLCYTTEPVTANDVKSEILWNNRSITIDRSPLNHGEWYRNGIVYVKALLDKTGNFYSHTKIGELYNVKCSILDILQVKHSLPRNWILLLRDNEFKDNTYTNTHICNLNMGHMTKNVEKSTCNDFNWLLVSQKIIPPICIKKWTEYFPSFNNADILICHRIFKLSFSVTRETRLHTFQFVLIDRIISCNKWICDKKIKSESGCNLCNDGDDLMHFFIYCENTKQFWTSFYKW